MVTLSPGDSSHVSPPSSNVFFPFFFLCKVLLARLPPFNPPPSGLVLSLPFPSPTPFASFPLLPDSPLGPSASVWPPSPFSVPSCGSPASTHGVRPASVLCLPYIPTPLGAWTLLHKAGPFIHSSLTRAQCCLCPGRSESSEDRGTRVPLRPALPSSADLTLLCCVSETSPPTTTTPPPPTHTQRPLQL